MVSAGTIHDLKALPETDTVVRVQAPKKTKLRKGLSEVWVTYSKEVKQYGHLVIYLEIVPKIKAMKGTKAKVTLAGRMDIATIST